MQRTRAADDAARLHAPSRILVVDDSESNRDLLSRRLLRDGYFVETAENGLLAMDKLRGSSFDLVLLDLMMPELNGYEVLQRLKEDEVLRHVPVLMISAVDDIESVIRCIEMGADDYLPKPFNPALLRARVESSLARKYLHDRERLYARSLEHELEIGRSIQAGFLPEHLPQPDGWEIAAYFRPARIVSGDFYDTFGMMHGRIGLMMADVCGKGVGAALFMALVRSLIRAFADRADGSLVSSDVEILTEAISATNAYVLRVHKSARMFASVFFGVLDPIRGRVSYVNAGHLPPVISGGQDVSRRLKPTGPAVGLSDRAVFHVATTDMAPGEVLVAFTDGITEARNPDREFFTEERLFALIERPGTTGTALIERVERALATFAGEMPATDDVTLLTVRRTADPTAVHPGAASIEAP